MLDFKSDYGAFYTQKASGTLDPDATNISLLNSQLHCIASLLILSYITGGAPDLQCKFENHCRPGLSRPGRPIVQFTADLDP